MKIDKAIEMLQFFYDRRVTHLADCELSAVKLGIEALKRFSDFRQRGRVFNTDFLPGETAEGKERSK